jgi:hypothetical protein
MNYDGRQFKHAYAGVRATSMHDVHFWGLAVHVWQAISVQPACNEKTSAAYF